MDAQGNATVTWDRFNGTSFVVQARRIDASGGLGAVQDLSATGQASKPLVVVDAQGNATVTWEDQGTN